MTMDSEVREHPAETKLREIVQQHIEEWEYEDVDFVAQGIVGSIIAAGLLKYETDNK